jgi:hypothetical protein
MVPPRFLSRFSVEPYASLVREAAHLSGRGNRSRALEAIGIAPPGRGEEDDDTLIRGKLITLPQRRTTPRRTTWPLETAPQRPGAPVESSSERTNSDYSEPMRGVLPGHTN